MTKIAIHGAAGRMGRMLIRETLETEGAILHAALEHAASDRLGVDAGRLIGTEAVGTAVTADLAALAGADVAIDFTLPAASAAFAPICAERGTALVLGTTGLDPAQTAAIAAAAETVPVVWAPNFSAGVTLLTDLVQRAARALDPAFDIEIVEMHHKHKIDAPSGTALGLGKAAARGRGLDPDALDAHGDFVRHGQTGAREAGRIGFATLRGGDVVGEHTVLLAGAGERLELGHRATDRRIFAAGAVRAALWSRGRAPGLYDMRDVLGLGA